MRKRANKLHTITPEHPFYGELIKHLDTAPRTDLNTWLDYKAMAADYNKLQLGGFLAFLYYGETNPMAKMRRAFETRGIKLGKSPADDGALYTLPVLSVEATALISEASSTAIPEQTYEGEPAVSIPLREAALPSESLPQIKNVWQVYLLKKSPLDALLEVTGRGRPRKHPQKIKGVS